jgi:hypothetical protein
MCIHCVLTRLGRSPKRLVDFLTDANGIMLHRLLLLVSCEPAHISDDIVIQIDDLLYALKYSETLESYDNVFDTLAYLVDNEYVDVDEQGRIFNKHARQVIH